ncbi:putative bifunctional diguanylate cyclase/phosphodiesterase [Aureimonas glaciei]|uniref:Diguanylate cyclase n=1 Tax=Aureimonas glaciei TaxID=1776957 RepID=A0A916XUB3_9HYPH|nr:EAL domain-containing protein [Aureimonas glaciei]GGD11483.1 diguanylate cyclase [Aureimonas glaciei]
MQLQADQSINPFLTNDVNGELARRWYRRRSPELHQLYNRRREEPRKRDNRLMVWVGVIIYVCFAGLDYLLIPAVADLTTLCRVTVSITAVVILELMISRGMTARLLEAGCGALILISYVAWLIPASNNPDTIALSYYMIFGAIFMMMCNLFFNLSFFVAAITSVSIFIICLISVNSPELSNYSYSVAFSAFFLSCFATTLYVNWKLNAERYNVFLNALQAEIRQNEVVERGEALLRLSNTDALTGLKNRRAIDERLRAHWGDWQTGKRGFATLLIDIDFFKNFNDHYGHQEGDRCLILVAQSLAELVEQHGATVGRFGGEEFIVLAQMADSEGIAPLAEAIRRSIEDLQLEHVQRPDGDRFVTVSIGAAFSGNQSSGKLERLITEADRALYRAKASGRNCIWVFDPNEPQARDNGEDIATVLQVAIAEGLVSLVYQPIRNVVSGRLEAAEVLMRLKMPDGRMISPMVFIPVAERTGAIMELGRWAIRSACQMLVAEEWLPLLSVNISAVQLKAPGFAISVAAILAETSISPQRMAFEVTEGREIETHPDVLRSIGELKQLGVKLWLDDFGTGFAGLSCLRAIEFDTVKIDRSFLHDTPGPRGVRLLQDIVTLLGNRGHGIVVEGVETERQLGLMRSFGIDCVQGYHVGRPMAADSLRRLCSEEAAASAVRASACG